MQVNSISFSGLWEKGAKDKIGVNKNNRANVYNQELIYHPFSDETREEISHEFEKYDNKGWAKPAKDWKGIKSYVIADAKIGEPLNVTKADYEKIKKCYQSIGKKDIQLSPTGVFALADNIIYK